MANAKAELHYPRNVLHGRREPGHATLMMDWLKLSPTTSCSKELGHATPAMSWLNSCPNNSCCKEAGHTTPTIGWLKLPSKTAAAERPARSHQRRAG